MEAIDGGKYGYFYTLGDIEDLKNKTIEAISDKNIGDRARQRVLEEYHWKVVIKKLENIYLDKYEVISKD
jgi:glycosyltransferase involved in cell wall biosynthesis